jgi:hypothetical protein
MSKKIRVIFKDGEQYAVVLWVKLTNKFVMVSHTLLESHYQQFYPTGTNFHRHEIYFKNGDFHSSFKFYDQHNHLYIDRKIYSDAIVIWSSPHPDFSIRCLEKLPRDDRNQDNAFINFNLKPWTDQEVGHVFGSLAYRFNYNGLRHFHKFDSKDLDPANDLLIDTSKQKDKIINVSAMFYKDGHSSFGNFSNWNTPEPPIIKTISVSHFKAVTFAILAPQERKIRERLQYVLAKYLGWQL